MKEDEYRYGVSTVIQIRIFKVSHTYPHPLTFHPSYDIRGPLPQQSVPIQTSKPTQS